MPASETPTNPTPSVPPAPRLEDRSTTIEGGAFREEEIELFEAEDAALERKNGEERPSRGARSRSRYVDYESHELLEKISEYEDDRRWQRIREGIWLSIILHFILFSGLTWIPRYVFHQPQVIDPFDAIKKRDDLRYIDELPDALKEIQKARPKLPPLNPKIDKKTMDGLKTKPKPAAPALSPAPAKAATPAPPPTVAQLPPVEKPAPLPPTVATPQPNPQIALDAPRPSPVPARPNFSLPSANPDDQLRQAMKGAAHGEGGQVSGPALGSHSGTAGGVQVLSDTQGVNFGPYLEKVIRETYRTWYPLIPEEVNPPILKRGQAEIVFTILPNGRLQAHAMQLSGRSGDVALDRAAWGAIEGADYPPLPREFHGPYLQLRFRFQYNVR